MSARRVTVVEVGPRDGLQNEAAVVPADVEGRVRRRALGLGALRDRGDRVRLAARDPAARGRRGRLPAHREAARRPLPVLVPNEKGLDRAEAAGVREIAVFTAASETFNRRNVNASIEESFARFAPVLARATGGGDARARLRLVRVRLPVRGAGLSGGRRARRGAPRRDRVRRGLRRRHDRDRRPDSGPGGRREDRRGGRAARAPRPPLPRHAGDRPRERRRGAARGRPDLRLVRGRLRRVPVRAGRRRERRDGGPRLAPPPAWGTRPASTSRRSRARRGRSPARSGGVRPRASSRPSKRRRPGARCKLLSNHALAHPLGGRQSDHPQGGGADVLGQRVRASRPSATATRPSRSSRSSSRTSSSRTP